MNNENIDNPDLHLDHDLDCEGIEDALVKLLGVKFIVVTDLVTFDFEHNNPQVWVHLRSSEHHKYRTAISIYGASFSLEQAKSLAAGLYCEIITDFDPALKQHQWQLIRPNGTVKVVSI